ncbi:hypothetical protein RSAG8_01447, partial [Rhizoctonia solani AG-8 WAC10335]
MADQMFTFDDSPTRLNNKNSNGGAPAPTGIAITEPIASQCIQRLIQIQLRVEGFKGANQSAMDGIEREVVSCELTCTAAGEENPDTSKTEKKDSSNKPRTLKHLPGQLPDLPPKHSVAGKDDLDGSQTSTAPKPSLSFLDQQLERNMLVQMSLQNIVKATDTADATPQPDLLSEVVNWETVGPQAAENIKRWNI